MKITITLTDRSGAPAALQEFYAVSGTPEEINVQLSDCIKSDLLSRAFRGQEQLDKKEAEAAQAATKDELTQGVAVDVKSA